MKEFSKGPYNVFAIGNEDGTPVTSLEEYAQFMSRCYENTENAAHKYYLISTAQHPNDENGKIVATCAIGEKSLSNACLLSAAPEMYSLCEEMLEAWNYFSEYDVPIGIKERLEAVLKKANGIEQEKQK